MIAWPTIVGLLCIHSLDVFNVSVLSEDYSAHNNPQWGLVGCVSRCFCIPIIEELFILFYSRSLSPVPQGLNPANLPSLLLFNEVRCSLITGPHYQMNSINSPIRLSIVRETIICRIVKWMWKGWEWCGYHSDRIKHSACYRKLEKRQRFPACKEISLMNY